MKEIKSFILCALILVSGMFSNHIFADGIDDIRNEFVERCQNFKWDKKIVEELDKIDGEVDFKKVSDSYADLFIKQHAGNSRVASAYFSKKFNEADIENREIDVVSEVDSHHTANLYKSGDQWYVADFIFATLDSTRADKFFAIPLKTYILLHSQRYRSLTFGVFNTTTGVGKDLGEFIPEFQPLLDEHHFMVYDKKCCFNYREVELCLRHRGCEECDNRVKECSPLLWGCLQVLRVCSSQ